MSFYRRTLKPTSMASAAPDSLVSLVNYCSKVRLGHVLRRCAWIELHALYASSEGLQFQHRVQDDDLKLIKKAHKHPYASIKCGRASPDRDLVNCDWTYRSKSSSSFLLITLFKIMRKSPSPMANSPVNTNSFHQLFFEKILHAFAAAASSGIRPAPSRKAPNTTNTTPMWSIPILWPTFVCAKKKKEIGKNLFMRLFFRQPVELLWKMSWVYFVRQMRHSRRMTQKLGFGNAAHSADVLTTRNLLIWLLSGCSKQLTFVSIFLCGWLAWWRCFLRVDPWGECCVSPLSVLWTEYLRSRARLWSSRRFLWRLTASAEWIPIACICKRL